MSGIYIPGMEMPKSCFTCPFRRKVDPDNIMCIVTREVFEETFAGTIETRNRSNCPLVPLPDHGRLIDADALVADLKRQCKEVFKTDAVSPNDFWITRNQAYNERLWTTWCESLFDYLKAAPTIIPADKEGEG